MHVWEKRVIRGKSGFNEAICWRNWGVCVFLKLGLMGFTELIWIKRSFWKKTTKKTFCLTFWGWIKEHLLYHEQLKYSSDILCFFWLFLFSTFDAIFAKLSQNLQRKLHLHFIPRHQGLIFSISLPSKKVITQKIKLAAKPITMRKITSLVLWFYYRIMYFTTLCVMRLETFIEDIGAASRAKYNKHFGSFGHKNIFLFDQNI